MLITCNKFERTRCESECKTAFVFTPSPFKLIKCNKQWWYVDLLSSLLKSWFLMLNCKCPNKCVVYRLYGFICDFLEFPSVKFSWLLRYIEYGGIRILNTKKVGLVLAVFFLNFANLCLLPLQKNRSDIFRWKTSSN